MVAKMSKRLESYPQVVQSTLDAMDGVAIAAADILTQLAESDAETAETLEQQNSLRAKLEVREQRNDLLVSKTT
jgi:mevalonate kinase